MRKGLAFISVLAILLLGFMALATPAAAQCGGDWFDKTACPVCGGFTNNAVPFGTDVSWTLTIFVRNDFGVTMTDVVVKDRLGGELEIVGTPTASKGTFTIAYKGATNKAFIDWNVGTLAPDETATLTMIISTDVNPGGQQEYTTPGCYELNSGATIKYKLDGVQYSASTDPIMINVLPPSP